MTIETPISTGLANPLANNATSVGQSVLSGETIINQPSDAKSAFDGTISASTSTVIPGSAMTADITSSAQFATAGTSFDAGEASAVTIAEGGSAEIDGAGYAIGDLRRHHRHAYDRSLRWPSAVRFPDWPVPTRSISPI